MPAKSPERRRISAVLAAVEKHNGPDDPRLAPLRADLAAAAEHEHVQLALDDPVALSRAAAIVRVALQRQALTLADLTSGPAGDAT